MEPTKKAPCVAVAENMVSLTFPGREPFLIWDLATLKQLVIDLQAAYWQWENAKHVNK